MEHGGLSGGESELSQKLLGVEDVAEPRQDYGKGVFVFNRRHSAHCVGCEHHLETVVDGRPCGRLDCHGGSQSRHDDGVNAALAQRSTATHRDRPSRRPCV